MFMDERAFDLRDIENNIDKFDIDSEDVSVIPRALLNDNGDLGAFSRMSGIGRPPLSSGRQSRSDDRTREVNNIDGKALNNLDSDSQISNRLKLDYHGSKPETESKQLASSTSAIDRKEHKQTKSKISVEQPDFIDFEQRVGINKSDLVIDRKSNRSNDIPSERKKDSLSSQAVLPQPLELARFNTKKAQIKLAQSSNPESGGYHSSNEKSLQKRHNSTLESENQQFAPHRFAGTNDDVSLVTGHHRNVSFQHTSSDNRSDARKDENRRGTVPQKVISSNEEFRTNSMTRMEILSQQREKELKRRQQALSAGAIRLNNNSTTGEFVDRNKHRAPLSRQSTPLIGSTRERAESSLLSGPPSVKQFSAPKNLSIREERELQRNSLQLPEQVSNHSKQDVKASRLSRLNSSSQKVDNAYHRKSRELSFDESRHRRSQASNKDLAREFSGPNELHMSKHEPRIQGESLDKNYIKEDSTQVKPKKNKKDKIVKSESPESQEINSNSEYIWEGIGDIPTMSANQDHAILGSMPDSSDEQDLDELRDIPNLCLSSRTQEFSSGSQEKYGPIHDHRRMVSEVKNSVSAVHALPEQIESQENIQAHEHQNLEPPQRYVLDVSNMMNFLTKPCPREAGFVQCYIRRSKNGKNKLHPEYFLYLVEEDKFLMCSKKRPNNKTSNYLVSMKAGDMEKTSINYVGKVRANFMGTEFQIFDNGMNPQNTGQYSGGVRLRNELGVVLYASNVIGARGPRKMQVAIPKINENGTPRMLTRTFADSKDEDMMTRLKNHNSDSLLYLTNKPPRWNSQVSAFVLNFNGRVTMASVKNFQLVTPDDHETVIVQFGRVAKDEFTMDFQWPISPFQAFAITLSSFDSKIACD